MLLWPQCLCAGENNGALQPVCSSSARSAGAAVSDGSTATPNAQGTSERTIFLSESSSSIEYVQVVSLSELFFCFGGARAHGVKRRGEFVSSLHITKYKRGNPSHSIKSPSFQKGAPPFSGRPGRGHNAATWRGRTRSRGTRSAATLESSSTKRSWQEDKHRHNSGRADGVEGPSTQRQASSRALHALVAPDSRQAQPDLGMGDRQSRSWLSATCATGPLPSIVRAPRSTMGGGRIVISDWPRTAVPVHRPSR